MGTFERLLEQIDAFIRKYYTNRMIKGLILFVGVFMSLFLVSVTLEYFGRFGHTTRALLFFAFIFTNLYILVRYILIPLLKIYSFGQRINRYQASDIIGRFFPDISDRLKNTLQLQDDIESNQGNLELLRASVQQRSNKLSVVPFAEAISIRANRKYVKWVLPSFLILLVLAVFAPSVLIQGTERVVNYDKEYKAVAPFSFLVEGGVLEAEEGEDIPVELVLKGSGLPEYVYVVSANGKFLMEKKAKNRFVTVIRKPKQSGSFYFIANAYESEAFEFKVHGKAVLGKFEATLTYPAYLGLTQEKVSNAGDITLPEGTSVEWSVLTKNSKETKVLVGKKSYRYTTDGFKLNTVFKEDNLVKVVLVNRQTNKSDSLRFNVSVVKDAFPQIEVQEVKDTVSDGLRFFSGRVSDDHGLRNLSFVYVITSENGKKRESRLNVRSVSGTDLPFDFAVDFRRENLQLKDRIDYYFVVSDNDGVNGSKSTKSGTFSYQLPSLSELNEKRDEEQEQIKKDMSDILRKAQEFQKNVDRLKKDVTNSKSNDWNKLNQINQLKEEQKDLQQSLEFLQQQMQNSLEEKNQLSEIDKDILEKQELIEKLLEELMDDELRKLLDELEKLMEQNNKEDVKDKLDDLQMSSEDMQKQLDRSLEMLKRLQVNEKIDDVEKELRELAKEQEELQEKIDKKELTNPEGAKEQKKLNERFDQLKKEFDELKRLDEELERPMGMDKAFDKEEKIENEMKDAKEQLDQNKQKKAGESQKGAAEDMKKMADELDQMQQQSNQQQQQEDIDSLRNILESLMRLSFDQEDVLLRMARISDNDPAYRRYGRLQRRIVDDTKIVRDSLEALAKRQPKIASFIDRELNDIASNHKGALDDIAERRRRETSAKQQFVMTSYNNLALLLNESLQSMQQQMQSMMEGSGSCNNPGGKGKPKPGSSMSPGDMKQMLKQQLEQMQKGMNEGGKSPGDKPGDKPGDQPGTKPGEGGQGMMGLGNKQIAKMAAEQTAIRQRLEQLRNELNKDGKGSGNALNPLIKELEQQERELINKRFDQKMINRQKEILTRLLESEKALMERGLDEKRESKSGKNVDYGNQIRFDEYNKQKLRQIELLKAVDPSLNKYYRDKANEYFNQR
jgi:hypothetical protein